MRPSDLRKLQIDQKKYLANEYKFIMDFTVVCTGFCLGTLSSSKIYPLFNLIIILVLLLIFIILSMNEMMKDSELRKTISALSKVYKKEPVIVKYIKSYDIWYGIQLSSFKHTGVVTICTLFIGYTAFEHYLRLMESLT